ncbi:UNVERIFIED_CONTAM: Scarecrow-like protein 18 [Sesamum latifolium]|uniref:Scarecrow-like protein 18 n=1 Tax=Sesamum latifolium TaxID=2727402 RepID=A0AAW2WRP7_9LAMI
MLGSFGSSSHEEEEEEEDQEPTPPNVYLHHQIQPRSFASVPPNIHMRQLLISCAELVSRSDISAARRLIAILSSNSSPYGDSTERLVHQFTKALSLRINRYAVTATASASASAATPTTTFLMIPNLAAASTSGGSTSNIMVHDLGPMNDDALLQSSYLSLNQVTPFIRFSQLTANQAILEAVEGQQAIHILDFDIMHGVQWPPLMQAIAERYPRRLSASQAPFHPLILLTNEDPISVASSVLLLPDETLVVNCVHYLHRLLKDRDRLHLFLHRIKAMGPRVLTVAEREANHNHPIFQQRFVEALDHYAAVFDSLEATLPPNSRERLAVEQIWFGREIADIVAGREKTGGKGMKDSDHGR